MECRSAAEPNVEPDTAKHEVQSTDHEALLLREDEIPRMKMLGYQDTALGWITLVLVMTTSVCWILLYLVLCFDYYWQCELKSIDSACFYGAQHPAVLCRHALLRSHRHHG